MNKNIKRRLYALALASMMVILPKTKAYANEYDLNEVIDIDKAISELVPDDTPVQEPTKPQPKEDDKKETPVEPTKPSESVNDNSTEDKKEEPVNGNTDNNVNNNAGTTNSNNTNGVLNNVSSQSQCNHTYSDVADDVINQVTPSCTEGGSYDEVYYCTKCGASKLVHYELSAPGHKWGKEHHENENELGYDLVRECTNKGCNEIWKIYIPKTPTEPTVTPTEPTKPGKQDSPKTGDDAKIELAAAIMGISAFGLPIASYNLKQELEKDKKGKYLRKK